MTHKFEYKYREALDQIDASISESRAERVDKSELKPKRPYRKREKPTAEEAERELLRANSRKAALFKLQEITKKVKAGEESPEVTIIINDEIFIISDRTDIFKIRDEKISQLEIALKRLKLFVQ